jgi:hypothetical protein
MQGITISQTELRLLLHALHRNSRIITFRPTGDSERITLPNRPMAAIKRTIQKRNLPTNGKMEEGGRALCRLLLMNMLGLETDQKDLRDRYAKQLGLAKHTVKLPKLT